MPKSQQLQTDKNNSTQLGDWMPLTHGLSEKSFGSRILDTLPTTLSGRLSAALQFKYH